MAGSFSVAVSGMLAQQDKMSVIGNNIANSRTTGFKASSLSFTEEFVSQGGQFINGTINQFGNGVKSSGVNVDWGDGAIEPTSLASNIAVAGGGFFPVEYQNEIYYTRAGDFAVVTNPNDATGDSFIFQRPNGAVLLGVTVDAGTELNTTAKPVTFTDTNALGAAPTSFEISPNGTVSCLPLSCTVSNPFIATQQFNNPDSLQRIEGGLYKITSLTSKSSENPQIPGTGSAGTLVQGALENSNVDLVTEFTSMIITQRSFQANSKTITTADEMMQTVMNLKR